MSTELILYIAGGLLAVSAVTVSFLGLRMPGFPGRFAPLIFLWFAILVGVTTTMAVSHARDEQNAKAAEISKAGEEASTTQAP